LAEWIPEDEIAHLVGDLVEGVLDLPAV